MSELPEKLEANLTTQTLIADGQNVDDWATDRQIELVAEIVKRYNDYPALQAINEALVKVSARLQNCWYHHQEGSDIRSKEYESHLFVLIFNDLLAILKNNSDYRTPFLPNEEKEIHPIIQALARAKNK